MLRKHSISLSGHRTSFSLEDEFWDQLKQISENRAQPLARLIVDIDRSRAPDSNLSSALRVFVLQTVLARQMAPNAADAPPTA